MWTPQLENESLHKKRRVVTPGVFIGLSLIEQRLRSEALNLFFQEKFSSFHL